MAIRQVLGPDDVSILTNDVLLVTVDSNLIRRDLANWKLAIWITKSYNRVDKLGGSRTRLEVYSSIVNDLGALTVPADAEFRLGALLHCLLHELLYT